MTPLSLGLVLLSALAHSTWNLLLKRSTDPELFVWWLLVAGSVLLMPLGLVLYWLHPLGQTGWLFVLATVVLHILYFLLLGRSYARADLSLVYPIARGMGPMLVPILAVVFLRETISGLAIAGIVAIVVGIYAVSLSGAIRQLMRQPLNLLRNPGTRYAILTGLTIATYAIVDKRGVSHVQPFLYMYLMILGCALGLAPYVLSKWEARVIGAEWRANPRPIIAAGLLTFLGYGLVLTAFSMSRVSYVAPAREVGIVLGVLMGVFILKEPFGAARIIGSIIVVAGLVLIAVAP
ncbi:MAG: EamA family transporter [Chloroflexi bacterium]|nr:EamA family transporter [Chloroflexota bacterium]MCI0859246.1 EamA family transporter [Chloroflexota bacterium]MCI0878352.1 EamA family transporter [Chloroflexota bacterium]